MFSVYGVKIVKGIKHRYYVTSFEQIDDAKHLCRLMDCDYAYVKQFGGATVFFLPISEDYYAYREKTGPKAQVHPIRQPAQPQIQAS